MVSISGVGLPSGTIEDAIFGRVSELEKMGAIFVVGTREANRTLIVISGGYLEFGESRDIETGEVDSAFSCVNFG